MVRKKWQNPKGKGRAQTYRLDVPVVPREEWVIEYDDALRILANGMPLAVPKPHVTSTNERSDSDERATADRAAGRAANGSNLPTAILATGPGNGVEPSPRERDQEPVEAPGLPDQTHGAMSPVPAPTAANSFPSPQGGCKQAEFRLHDVATKRLLKRLVRELRADPGLPPLLRYVLQNDPKRLPERYRRVRRRLLRELLKRHDAGKPLHQDLRSLAQNYARILTDDKEMRIDSASGKH